MSENPEVFSNVYEETGYMSPINSLEPETNGAASSAVNPSEGEKKTSAEKSTVNPVTATPTETTVEKTAGTVTGAPTVLPKEAEAPKPSTAINISVETPNIIFPQKTTDAPNSAVFPEKREVIREFVVLPPEKRETPSTAAPPVSSPVNEETKKIIIPSQEQRVSKLLGVSVEQAAAALTNVTSSTQTINAPQLTEQKTTSASNVTSNTTTNVAESNVINQSEISSVFSTKKAQDALTNKYFKSIFASAEKTSSPTSEKVETGKAGEISTGEKMSDGVGGTAAGTTQMEVSKTSPSFSEKIPPSSEKIIEKSNAAMVEKTQAMIAQNENKETAVTVTQPIAMASTTATTASPGTEQSASSGMFLNMAGLESRLARLEYLLSNPLEVKIIE